MVDIDGLSLVANASTLSSLVSSNSKLTNYLTLSHKLVFSYALLYIFFLVELKRSIAWVSKALE